jgi:hypothetical protein
MKKIVYPLILVFLCFVWLPLAGQNTQTALDKAEKKAVIDALNENLEREYIFPEITEEYVGMLNQNFRSGRYDGIGNPEDFARTIPANISIHSVTGIKKN